MSILASIILGIIQGLTEFLPISSSGHIAIVNHFLNSGFEAENYGLMTIVLHAATAISTIYVFRKDIKGIIRGVYSKDNNSTGFSIKILLSMIPASIVGFFWEDNIESIADNYKEMIIYFVGSMLFVTALLLLLADKAKTNKNNIGFVDSIIIGVSQAIALLPGISRSGATISTCVLLGLDKEKSARFSFLMVVPLILGKITKDIFSGRIDFSSAESLPLLFGFISAFIVGVISCKWMITIVKNSRLRYFSYYCFFLGLTIILFEKYSFLL